jgi:hypothetical protein
MMRSLIAAGLSMAGLVGCAHNKANQYSYAPPLAPPVYPQPQMAQPVGMAAPPGGVMPAPQMGAAVLPTGGVDPCCQQMGGTIVGQPVVYEEGQTPPCPPM